MSELSFQEGSVYNSEMECANFEQQSQTEPLDMKLEQQDRNSESHYSMPQMIAGDQMQIQAMQEEILYLRGQMALLQSKLASIQDNIDTDIQSGKLDDLENVRISPNAKSNYTNEDLCELNELSVSLVDELLIKSQITKKKLQPKLMLTQPLCDSLSSLSGNQSNQIAFKANETPTKRNEYARNIETDTKELRKQNFEYEMQRLQRSIDHLRVQNNVLSLNFADCKVNCEHLYLLCGKYESNAIALNQALNLSDRTIEAYDVMLALLESKLAILEKTESAIENRKAAEKVAKHLMQRLENDIYIQGNSLGPWQDAATVMYASNTTNQTWTDKDDRKLREQMSKLKGQRASVQNTVVILESPYKDYEGNSSKSTEHTLSENRKADLETAVLMEELLSVRENFNDMKYRAEQLEKEKNLALEALIHLQEQLADSEALLAMSKKDRTSYSDAEQNAGIELELVEALARESRLKARLQALASSLETATKSSEEKYFQVQSTVAELKQANV